MTKTEDMAVPAPGSAEATEAGCICAVVDNHHGAGARGQAGVYWITIGCPLHTPDFVDVLPSGASLQTKGEK